MRDRLANRLRHPRTGFAARAALAAVGAFVAAAVALNLASIPNEPLHMSEFAHTPAWWVWQAGLYAFAGGGLLLTWAAAPVLPRHRLSGIGLALLGAAGVGALFVATFPVDSTPQATTLAGFIHNQAAWPTFLALGLAMLVWGHAFARSPLWESLAPATLWMGRSILLLGVAYIWADGAGSPSVGIVQRAIVALAAAWLLLLAVRLLELGGLASRGRLRGRRERRELEPSPA